MGVPLVPRREEGPGGWGAPGRPVPGSAGPGKRMGFLLVCELRGVDGASLAAVPVLS